MLVALDADRALVLRDVDALLASPTALVDGKPANAVFLKVRVRVFLFVASETTLIHSKTHHLVGENRKKSTARRRLRQRR